MGKPQNPNPEVGDLFKLKGGGPVMTVYDVEELTGGTLAIRCGWFWRGRFNKETFALGELKKVERTYLSGEDTTVYSRGAEQN